jgi:hypothetical protein
VQAMPAIAVSAKHAGAAPMSLAAYQIGAQLKCTIMLVTVHSSALQDSHFIDGCRVRTHQTFVPMVMSGDSALNVTITERMMERLQLDKKQDSSVTNSAAQT